MFKNVHYNYTKRLTDPSTDPLCNPQHVKEPTIDCYVVLHGAIFESVARGKACRSKSQFLTTANVYDSLPQVQQWLSSAFKGDQRITGHPINTQAINLLYDVTLEAKRDEGRFQLVAQGYRQRAEEYKTEGTFVCHHIKLNTEFIKNFCYLQLQKTNAPYGSQDICYN